MSVVQEEGLFLTFVNAMLGPWLRGLLAWMVEHQTMLAGIASVWLGVVGYGIYQLHQARRLAEGIWKVASEGGIQNSEEAYDRWCQEASKRTWIVPTSSGLWVERVTIDELAKRVGFSVKDSLIGSAKQMPTGSVHHSPRGGC